jgi:integrase
VGRKRTAALVIDGKRVDLPLRVYIHGLKLRLIPRSGKPIILGTYGSLTEYGAAMEAWAKHTALAPVTGTVEALYDWFIKKIKLDKQLAARTIADYEGAKGSIVAGLGKNPDGALTTEHTRAWRDLRGREAPVRANREMAALSACYTAAIGIGRLKMIHPCRGIKRLTERPRKRYITDAEYWAVYEQAIPSVRIMMTLVYRTLQRIEDLMNVGPANVKTMGGHRVLRIEPGKLENSTGVVVDIELTGELQQIVDAHLAQPVVYRTFVHTEEGEPYTYNGMHAMFYRYVTHKEVGLEDFSLYDLKGKGATDMFIAGMPMHTIQKLCGHAYPSMTEKYIKARLPQRVTPNQVEMQREKKA